jgi:hypothetical protein
MLFGQLLRLVLRGDGLLVFGPEGSGQPLPSGRL